MEDGRLAVKVECPTCNSNSPTKPAEIHVNYQGFKFWLVDGVLIQRAFPELMPFDDLRERLQTGICTVCWDEMFREEFSDDDF
jgi:hypothetical protein